ncbi:hypothetical protein HanXRQr2_Chr16g0765551 [Helianthus annuus]|uniref:Uncharacterized protein n=1 Tax=Helianthus annuus TaxID=4232 RepID=A0A9K3DVG2_HELAN|nr:hypothetical protein HanXRQr2_Chr16g0765551 [Helianthus annuus]KAJ0822582.1 hypothetical protein HanPSC8_Chr16g0733741 [Helianthus annuus]
MKILQFGIQIKTFMIVSHIWALAIPCCSPKVWFIIFSYFYQAQVKDEVRNN